MERTFVSLMLLAACAGESSESAGNLSCGPGTHEEDGQCVAGNDTGGETGTDTDTGTETGTDTGTDTGGACDVALDGSAAFDDIQAAVDAAKDGDTIRVCAGTYDYVELERHDLTLVGAAGAAVTTISGGAHPAVTADSVSVTLRGFTLTGDGQNDEPYTAALYQTNGQVTLVDVVITGCGVGTNGGGQAVAVRSGDAVWDHVELLGNSMGERGVLVSVFGTSGALVSLTITELSMHGNNASIAFHDQSVDTTITNSLFYGNDFPGMGGGIFDFGGYRAGDGALTIWNSVFYDNQASNGSSLPTITGAYTDFQNNIVAESGGTFPVAMDVSTTSYNLYFHTDPVTATGTGNLFIDPHFVDAGHGDFHLDTGFSPAINAGNPLSGYNDSDGTRNDLGIYGGPGGSDW